MDLLQQSAQAWKEITEYRYLFTYGYKKQLYPINLTFSLEDYPHLAGFQYMKDISLPNYSSAKIADRILEGKIPFEKVQKAARYDEMIKPRLESNQRTRTLMKKERIHIFSNTTDILLDRLSAQTKPKDKATEISDNTEAKSDDSQ